MKVWRLPSQNFSLDRPRIMGILNITPDSFSDGGNFFTPESALRQASHLIEEGADILDLGAESTRPGAENIPADIQIERLLPILKSILKLGVPVSIDTTHAEVAEACLQHGAKVINDVSGLRDSAGEVARVAAKYQAGLILMHRRGNAETMQKLAIYEDLITEVIEELKQSVQRALEWGVAREALIMDPGLGFSKTAEQSFFILKEIKRFETLEIPLLIGPSRKSFIGKATARDVEEREFGTAACIAHGLTQGIRFFRVHNAGAARDVIRTMQAIESAEFLPNAKMGCF